MFKSEKHKAGFYRLKHDYEAFEVAMATRGGDCTRLFENTFIGFEEQCWDELFGCFEEGWFDEAKQGEYDNVLSAGSVTGIFELVERYDTE